MKKLKFGIDVDGVLRDLISEIINVYNKQFSKNMTLEQFVHYDVNDQFPELPNAVSYFFSGEMASHLLRNSKPIEGALNAFKILSGIGTVHIITSQHGYDNVRYTLEWLHKNGFDTDQICFVHDKSVVKDMDYFIDDNPDKFINVECKHAVLIDMPYNRYDLSEIMHACKCETFERFNSLESFVNNIIKK